MSNKTDLQALNAKYESLIEELRGKAVVGGGSLETCTVTIDGYPAPGAKLYYLDGNLELHEDSVSGTGVSIQVLKNSLLVAGSLECNLIGATLVIGNGVSLDVYQATG